MDHDGLIEGLRAKLQSRGEVTEARVLRGDGCFLDGRLVAAVLGDDLCVQVGREDWDSTLSGDGVRPLLFADLPVPGWVMIDGGTVTGEEALAIWIERALARH